VKKLQSVFERLASLQDAIEEYIDITSPPLLWISMRLTLVCNLSCPFCSAASLYRSVVTKDLLSQYSIPIDIAKRALDDAAKLGALILEITGGEPFVYPDIIELLKYADDLGFEIAIATNATKIDQNVAKELSKLENINNVQISLDGATEQTHDSIRGKGVFKRVMEAIKLLKEYNVPFTFNTVLSKLNVHELDKILDLALEMNARGIRISFVAKFGRGVQVYDRFALSFTEMMRVRDKVYDFFRRHRGKIKVGVALPLLLVPDDMKYDLYNFKSTTSCNTLTYVGINFDGSVGPCTYMLKPLREYVLGDLFRSSLTDVWRSQKFREFRMQILRGVDELRRRNPCMSCKYKDNCLGNCVAETYNNSLGFKLVEPNPYCVSFVQSAKEAR